MLGPNKLPCRTHVRSWDYQLWEYDSTSRAVGAQFRGITGKHLGQKTNFSGRHAHLSNGICRSNTTLGAGAAGSELHSAYVQGRDVSYSNIAGAQGTMHSVDPRQLRTPLVEAVRERGDAVHEAPFHVPGHKRGAGAPKSLASLTRPATGSVLQYDLTEIAGLDFLSSPSGVIQEAQQLAAEAFGADQTWFLVNGCSVGIHAAVMAVTATAAELEAVAGCGFGAATGDSTPQSLNSTARDQASTHGSSSRSNGSSSKRIASSGRATLIVARNCHLSAFSAMVLAGCEPYWVQPEVDPVFGVGHCVTHASVRTALHRASDQGRRIAGVLIVSPTYFGAVADVEAIAAVCHEYGVPLIVDEAHGGHFAFLPSHSSPSHAPPPPPPAALRCGADAVIHSTHKVLGAMTQAAMLHVSGPRVSPAHVSRALQTLQSSSPSYVLMASLDAARAQAVSERAFHEPCAAAQAIRDAVSCCRRLRLLDEQTAGSKRSVRYFDPLRLTLLVKNSPRLPKGGFSAAEWMERYHGVVPELATAKTVVLALGPGTTLAHATTATHAIMELDQLVLEEEKEEEEEEVKTAIASIPTSSFVPTSCTVPTVLTAANGSSTHNRNLSLVTPDEREDEKEAVEMVLTPREAYFASSERVPTAEALGRISAELLCPYPPGVPALFPGERITAAALEVLGSTLRAGGAVTGAHDGSLKTLAVVVNAAASAATAPL